MRASLTMIGVTEDMKVVDLGAYDCISRVSLLMRIVTAEGLQGICPHHNNIFQSIFRSMAFLGAQNSIDDTETRTTLFGIFQTLQFRSSLSSKDQQA